MNNLCEKNCNYLNHLNCKCIKYGYFLSFRNSKFIKLDECRFKVKK